ncbi:MAG TPA: aquaporin [Gemmatimonadales bacterium]|jgi:aquaporin Z
MRPLVAEAFGTFFLCFCGIGAIISDLYRPGNVGFLSVALAHGVALAIAITATVGISGGHLNPAVTLGLFSVGRIEARKAGLYIIAQLAGGVIAVLALKGLYPDMAGRVAVYGMPRLANDITAFQGVMIEAILTFMLSFAVMGTIVNPRSAQIGGFGVGLIVFVDILAGGTMTGAAMNPARAFAPMLVGMQFTGALIYWIGPILGSVVAFQLWERLLLPKTPEELTG